MYSCYFSLVSLPVKINLEDLLQLRYISLNLCVHQFEMGPLNVILKWVLVGEA